MRLSRIALPCALLIVAGVAVLVQGCQTPDTIVKVTVTGQVPSLRQLHVTFTAGGQDHTFDAPEEAQALVLPTGFTLQLRREITGRLDVTIEGRDGAGEKLAEGMGFVDELEAGAVYALTIDLGGEMTDGGTGDKGPADGGTDGGADGEMDGGMDAGAEDTGAEDTGAEDTGADDTGPEDTGAEDTGAPDTGAEDLVPDVPEDVAADLGDDVAADLGDDLAMDIGDDLMSDLGDGADLAGDVADDAPGDLGDGDLAGDDAATD